jgi:hypothetical protein
MSHRSDMTSIIPQVPTENIRDANTTCDIDPCREGAWWKTSGMLSTTRVVSHSSGRAAAGKRPE